jgi:hypothetical protein
MQGPDGVDRVQYVPPDRVMQSQHADPDKRQKFSRALEEEEDELEKHRKRRPHDQVELGPEAVIEPEGADGEPEETPDEAPEEGAERTDETKHIDVKA